jgi:hypothetical protein
MRFDVRKRKREKYHGSIMPIDLINNLLIVKARVLSFFKKLYKPYLFNAYDNLYLRIIKF